MQRTSQNTGPIDVGSIARSDDEDIPDRRGRSVSSQREVRTRSPLHAIHSLCFSCSGMPDLSKPACPQLDHNPGAIHTPAATCRPPLSPQDIDAARSAIGATWRHYPAAYARLGAPLGSIIVLPGDFSPGRRSSTRAQRATQESSIERRKPLSAMQDSEGRADAVQATHQLREKKHAKKATRTTAHRAATAAAEVQETVPLRQDALPRKLRLAPTTAPRGRRSPLWLARTRLNRRLVKEGLRTKAHAQTGRSDDADCADSCKGGYMHHQRRIPENKRSFGTESREQCKPQRETRDFQQKLRSDSPRAYMQLARPWSRPQSPAPTGGAANRGRRDPTDASQ